MEESEEGRTVFGKKKSRGVTVRDSFLFKQIYSQHLNLHTFYTQAYWHIDG
jgi:hypothetical protein